MLLPKASSLQGIVVAIKANYLEVEIESSNNKGLDSQIKIERLLCTKRRKLDHKGISVYAGDRVFLESIDWNHHRAVISDVRKRTSLLTRPSVANATKVLVAISLREPKIDFHQASRFLLKAEETGLNVRLIFS